MDFFGGVKPRNKPVIKKMSVSVPVKRLPIKSTATPSSSQTHSRPLSKGAQPPARKQEPKERVKRQLKRKAPTPTTVLSDEDDDSGAESSSSSLAPRKRQSTRSSASSVDPDRRIADLRNRSAKDQGKFAFVHGAALVEGEAGKKSQSLFDGDEPLAVELQYPSDSQRERFILVTNADYQPHDDIRETIKYICLNYLPEKKAEECLDDEHGFERRLNRAVNRRSREEYVAAISDFNGMITEARDNGTVARILASKHSIDKDWLKRITEQVYSRTVSPHSDTVRKYQERDNVYGELLAPLVYEMLEKVQLKSDQVFIDLGSGVGNVVLQAALQTGAESWGIEQMSNCCRLAELQAKEFAARARLWGLSIGKVRLLEGSFFESSQIDAQLRRADVIIVNNKVFSAETNEKLVSKFLDLKDGCQIVSLQPFKPSGFPITERNCGDPKHMLVEQARVEYFSGSVSWADVSGNDNHYYIVKKDPKPQAEFLRANGYA